MNLSLIILLVISVLFLLGFMYIEPILMKHKVKNDNEYGSARFSTDKEIKKNFKKENVNNIKEAGFPVSFKTSERSFAPDITAKSKKPLPPRNLVYLMPSLYEINTGQPVHKSVIP